MKQSFLWKLKTKSIQFDQDSRFVLSSITAVIMVLEHCITLQKGMIILYHSFFSYNIQKQRRYFANKGSSSQGYGFSRGHVWMWELDCEECWAPKNWCFWTVVLEKTLESPLDFKEIQPVHSEGDQPWDFFGRNDAKAETPVLWPPHTKSWLIGKDFDAGRDWGQEKKGTTEDEMAGWHHWLDGHESEWTPGVGDGQGGLACCDSLGCKKSDTTERLIWSDLNYTICTWLFDSLQYTFLSFYIYLTVIFFQLLLSDCWALCCGKDLCYEDNFSIDLDTVNASSHYIWAIYFPPWSCSVIPSILFKTENSQ